VIKEYFAHPVLLSLLVEDIGRMALGSRHKEVELQRLNLGQVYLITILNKRSD
jgi:hypothetical protein